MEPAVHGNGEDAAEGREGKEAEPGSPRRCDIIFISSRKEKCEAAKEALEALVPVTIEWRCPLTFTATSLARREVGYTR